MTDHKFTYGPTRYFVPVCILHPHGFYGGPCGYEEDLDGTATKPIVVVAENIHISSSKGVLNVERLSIPRG